MKGGAGWPIVALASAGAGVNVNVGTGTTNFVVTFSGPDVGADGSLPDGVYDLTIVADKVHDSAVPSMTLAANVTSTFHRLLADANGDATIGRFLAAQGRSGVPLYLFYAPDKPVEVLPQVLTASRLTALAG